MSTKPITVATSIAIAPALPAAPPVSARAAAKAGVATVAATVAGSATAPPAPPRRATRRIRWDIATPWLMAAVVLLCSCLAWFTVDLLQDRLHESTRRVHTATRGFDRFWTLHDAATEATLAVKWDLAAPAEGSSGDVLQADALRFAAASTALRAEISRPGGLPLSQGASWAVSAAGLSDLLQQQRNAPDRPRARAQAQAALDALARVTQEARQRQSMAAAVLDDVEGVRRQLLFAFAAVVALLVLVLGMAVQWLLVARRERVIRRRAEQLAGVAETERAKADSVARDKARFLGMLGHELLTPLQSIWSTMDLIESRGRVDAADPAFTRLKESARSLRGRISDLVDFAKMSSGRLETRIRGFQLDKLVDTALRGVEEALALHNLDVHWEAGPELSQRIYSDPARLRQVIDNLLTNAIKYTERGGITIHAELHHDKGMLSVEISDTGVGIHPEAMSRLFEPFYRSPQTAGMAEGSGLGLAVVRSLVDLMGGSIRVDSTLGQGTAVTVQVPITPGTDGPDEPVDIPSDAPLHIDTRRPVLVVDDSRDARRAIVEVIRTLGIEVVEAIDGITGLDAAARHDYQAIFLDMQMPGMTGLEIARSLRRPGDRHEKTFLVLISAFSDLDDATVDSVFDTRLDKPVDRRQLVAALGRASQGRA